MDDRDGQYVAWRADAEILAVLGQVLFAQDLTVRVRLPASLAAQALASWAREEDGDGCVPTDESRAEKRVRHQSGSLALIGLAIENEGPIGDDDLIIDLNAWHIGAALDAAEERDLLSNIMPFRPSP